ncbi:prepilin peptidase [Lentibacillus lipolyticus]|nr:prepilin peptidase [Lentibacillus lipolyticus]
MDNLLLFFFFLLGLIFGSFFHVVGLRVPQKQPFTNDRSLCPQCKHTLSWFELIPVLSYIFQQGKCRYCHERIGFLYPVIELTTGVLFACSYGKLGLSLELIIALLLMSMLIILFVSDLTYMLIPNSVLLFFLPLFIFMRMIQPLEPWWSPVAGAVTGIGILAIIIIISRGGMGAGDMKLFGVLGIVLGLTKTLLTFFLACLIGAVIGMTLLTFQVVHRKQAVPFGPYIAIAAVLAYFYGDGLVNWYVAILNKGW